MDEYIPVFWCYLRLELSQEGCNKQMCKHYTFSGPGLTRVKQILENKFCSIIKKGHV